MMNDHLEQPLYIFHTLYLNEHTLTYKPTVY